MLRGTEPADELEYLTDAFNAVGAVVQKLRDRACRPRVRPPSRSDGLHATALAAAGIKEEQGLTLDGVDLVPYVTGGEKGPLHEALYWRFGPQMAIRAGNGRES